MFRIKIALLGVAALATLMGGPAPAQTITRARAAQDLVRPAELAHLFPLAVGNTWSYAGEGLGAESNRTVTVTASEEIAGVTYYRLEGYGPGSALVRINSRGQMVAYDGETGLENLWYDFAAPIGGSWLPQGSDECLGTATLADREAAVKTPAGSFPNALRVTYGGSICADAGIAEEAFGPGVGLLRREEISIAGPRIYTLRQARISGMEMAGPGLGFSLRLDRAVYTPDLMPPVGPDGGVPQIQAQLTIENSTDSPVVLNFNSGQRFDLAILDANGNQVYTWSADKLFTADIGQIELPPGGAQTFAVEIPAADLGGNYLPAGDYVVEAWLTTAEGRRFSASVGIEVTDPIF